MALYTVPRSGPATMKPDPEVRDRAAELVQLHSARIPVATRIKTIINGGRAGLEALLGKVPQNEWTVPAANLILSGSDRLAQKMGDRPDIRVDAPGHTDAETPKERAAKIERIVEFYDDISRLELDLPQVARWLPGYGFVCWIVRDGYTPDGQMVPLAELRDSSDCFPAPWGASQQSEDLVVRRRIERHRLARIYGDRVPMQRSRLPGGAVMIGGGGSGMGPGTSMGGDWEGTRGADAIDLWEYYDDWGCTVLLSGGTVLDRIPNRLTTGPQFVVAKRYTFDALTGAWDQGVGLLAAMAKFNVLAKIAMEDAVFAPVIVKGRMDGEFRKGRNAVNYIEGGDATLLQQNLPYQMFQEIDRVERQFRVTSGYSPQQDGEPQMSFVTGRGLNELATGIDNSIREYHKVIRWALEAVDAKRLEWDEAMPDARKVMEGKRQGTPFAEKYRAVTDIAGHRRTRRAYGAMAGFDDHQKIVAGLQLVGANVISRQTMMENLSGLDNIPRELDRIDAEQAKATLIQLMLAPPQEGAQMERAALTLIEMLPEGEMKTRMQKFWTPQGKQISPEEQQMIDMMGAGQEPLELPGQMPDVSTALSMLGAGGEVGGGLQTLSRLS